MVMPLGDRAVTRHIFRKTRNPSSSYGSTRSARSRRLTKVRSRIRMRIQTGWERVRQNARQHGLAKTAHRIGYGLLKRSASYLSMHCIWAACHEIRGPSPAEIERLRNYSMRFLDDAEVLRIASRPECRSAGMSEAFARAALAEQHRCMAIREGDFVAHFSWYSRRSPARINDAWTMHFDEAGVYIYFVHTDPQYRGQKLLPFAVQTATRESGVDFALAFVESANYSSLNSFYKMGFRDFARIRVARVFGRPLMLHGEGCGQFGFRVTENLRQRLAAQPSGASAATPGNRVHPMPSAPPPADRKTCSASRSGEYR